MYFHDTILSVIPLSQLDGERRKEQVIINTQIKKIHVGTFIIHSYYRHVDRCHTALGAEGRSPSKIP